MARSVVQCCLIIVFTLSACSPSVTSIGEVQPSPTQQGNSREELLGRVVDENGVPVPQANIKTESGVVLTDMDGWFHIPSREYTQWVTVYKLGYISRTRAATPGMPVLIRVSPDDGKTLVLKFTGDVMFGRRFFDMNSDGNTDDGILPVEPSVGDHLRLLEPISLLLKDSDVTAINLESVVNPDAYFSPKDTRPVAFHPTKDYVYATYPNAMAALMEDGVNVIGLGNNHVYDMLDPGMENMLGILDQMGLAHFGAGMDEEDAWKPAVVTVKGQKIAFIGCTTIFASEAEPKPDEITYTASDSQKKGGAAHCDRDRLNAAIKDARRTSDLVIVMIHGGVEYDQNVPAGPLRLTEVAKQAGAQIVVNHHPHVVSGFSWEDGNVIARSLGNFISDQTIWPSLESYLFTVYVRDGKVVRAFIEPVLLHDNIARGITGELADYVARDSAGLEAGPFIIESDTMEVDVNGTSKQVSKSVSLDGGSGMLIQVPPGQWISGFKGKGTLMLGRDLLWVGGFENTMVDDVPSFLPLWNQANSASLLVGPDFAYQGSAGIRLVRINTNTQDVVTTNIHRVLVKPDTKITIAGMYRGSTGAQPSLLVSWYPDTFGPSNEKINLPLAVTTPEEWQSFQLDVVVPPTTVAMQTFLKLSPPMSGTATVDFDNIRIIAWSSPEELSYSPVYDFASLTGEGELTFTQSMLPGGEPWLTVSNTDLSKFTFKQAP